ncbi:MAG: response regulator [Bacteroidota bacterium]
MTSKWNNATILIVEDVVSNIMYYKSAFKHSGANILLATDGEQAVEMVKSNPNIDIILMDIHMPKMSGLEASTIIREISPKISIIIQTAYVLLHTEAECIAAGADVFLEKPISLSVLHDIINDLMKNK